MRLNGTTLFSTLQLAESGVPTAVQMLRVGKFNHPKYGKFEITSQTLAEMKANFDARVYGIDPAFDYYHDSDKDAAGWPKALELREDGTELWAVNIEWTPPGAQKLADKALRYFSPDFAFRWKDPESGKVHSNVLFGGGLTNRPFVKEMQAIVADERDEMTELEKAQARVKELETANVKLSEEKTAAVAQMADMQPKGDAEALKAQIAELQAKLAKLEGDHANVLAEKTKMEAEKVLAEKESEFTVLLTEGKACAAQKDAFIKGDMKEFLKLSQPVNLKGAGSTASGDEGAKEDRILKLAEEKRKADPQLEMGDAISLAKKEIN